MVSYRTHTLLFIRSQETAHKLYCYQKQFVNALHANTSMHYVSIIYLCNNASGIVSLCPIISHFPKFMIILASNAKIQFYDQFLPTADDVIKTAKTPIRGKILVMIV